MKASGNPFVGLRPFEAEESVLFFGRRPQILELLQVLHESRFVGIVGSSGCGKSSLVRAGLIPKLQAGFLVRERDIWHIARMQPGTRPLTNLSKAFSEIITGPDGASGSAKQLEEAVREQGLQAILEQTSRVFRNPDTNLLLLVDQFEELFRFGMSGGDFELRDEASEFVSLLLALADQRDLPIYVILTMRSDFLGDCDAFIGLPEAMNRSQYLVPRLTRRCRREAIEGPIRLFGAEITSRLTDRLLNETGDARDDLPVLQHVLMRTWDEWKKEGNRPIDTPDYESVGTIRKALSNDADAALEGLTDEGLALAKRLFQALTETDASNRCVRRPARLEEVVARTGSSVEAVWEIVQRFRGRERNFLVLSSPKPEENPLIDISHESLIRQWSKLSEWVEQEAESARIYSRLAETARMYQAGKAGLYRDPDLRVALSWREREKPDAAWGKRYSDSSFQEAMAFLDESQRTQEREKLAEQERARRELQRTRRFSLILGALLLIAVGTGAYALYMRGVAEEERLRAEDQRKVAEERNQEIERLILQASEQQDKIKSFNDLINGAIEDVITPRARAEPYQQNGRQVTDRAGRKLYLITCWVEIPDLRKEEVRRVVYRFNHPSFYLKEKAGENRSDGYAISYVGWGCLSRVDLSLVKQDGEVVGSHFNLCQELGW